MECLVEEHWTALDYTKVASFSHLDISHAHSQLLASIADAAYLSEIFSWFIPNVEDICLT